MSEENSQKANLEEESDLKKFADELGVDLEDTDDDSDGNQDEDKTSKTKSEEGEKDDTKNQKSDDDVDYKKRYSEATKEFQTKYKPMEDNIKEIEKMSGKTLDELKAEFVNKQNDSDNKSKQDDTNNNDILEKVSSLESKLNELTSNLSERDQVSAKKTVDSFIEKHGIDEEEYSKSIQPLLSGIKEMRKEDGTPYDLAEGLEMAYILKNRDKIDQMVEKKALLKSKEKDMSFSPVGSKQSSDTQEKKVSQGERDMARKLGIELE